MGWAGECGAPAVLCRSDCERRAQDELFGGVYSLFKGHGHQAALLRKLEGPILRDQLPSLEPEPLQDLVNHFVAEGKPERVERCVLHLNVATLDLNRVRAPPPLPPFGPRTC